MPMYVYTSDDDEWVCGMERRCLRPFRSIVSERGLFQQPPDLSTRNVVGIIDKLQLQSAEYNLKDAAELAERRVIEAARGDRDDGVAVRIQEKPHTQPHTAIVDLCSTAAGSDSDNQEL